MPGIGIFDSVEELILLIKENKKYRYKEPTIQYFFKTS
jgi:hypothetical protein